MRPVRVTRHYTMHAEGSVLIAFGNTQVLCAASVEEKVPPHKRGQVAKVGSPPKYGMLPRATHTRSDREGRQAWQTERLAPRDPAARSAAPMRPVFDLKKLGERNHST
jgi:ribonuclease PH